MEGTGTTTTPRIRSIQLMTLDWCNSICLGCKIYTNRDHHYFTPDMVQQLLSHPEFSGVEDIGFSGGEPMLMPNVSAVVGTVIRYAPNLQTFFFNTNATVGTHRIIDLIKEHSASVPEFHLLVSLDGDQETYAYTRGIDNYHHCIEVLKAAASLRAELPTLRVGLSATLFRNTARVAVIDHLVQLARELDITYTFRFGSLGDMFYQNTDDAEAIEVPPETQVELLDYLQLLNYTPPFIDWTRTMLETGRNPVMLDGQGRNICRAGDLFVFVNARGDIYPCHLSNRKIGTYQTGIVQRNLRLGGVHEPCPCLTECTAYPQAIFNAKYPQQTAAAGLESTIIQLTPIER